MTNSYLRNVLIVAGTAAILGIGVSGCGKPSDQSSQQSKATQGITDTAITAGVKAKLAANRDIDSADISVSTVKGTVTLTGSVDSSTAKSAAETTTRSVGGVNNVLNRIDVAPSSVAVAAKETGEAIKATGDATAQAVSDTWITTKVKSVLLADGDAKGMEINVDTKDGVVTLEGTLISQAAVDHVKALARGVEGVKRVDFSALTVARR